MKTIALLIALALCPGCYSTTTSKFDLPTRYDFQKKRQVLDVRRAGLPHRYDFDCHCFVLDPRKVASEDLESLIKAILADQ